MILTVVTEEVPRIPNEKRLEINEVASGFVRLIARYGFMQTPRMPKLIELAVEQKVFADPSQVTYFVRSEEIALTRKRNMQRWRKRFYAFLNRNTQEATSLWNLPADQVVGIRLSTEL